MKNLENDGFVTFLRGQGLTKENVVDNGTYKCILYGELYTKYKKAIIDRVLSYTNIKTNILSKKGDVLIPATTTADAYGIAIGRAISEDNIEIGGDINIVRTENKILNAKYLAELLCNTLKEPLAQYATGNNILHLSNDNIRNLKIPLPPFDIQQKIVDEIEKIDKQNNIIQSEILKKEADKHNFISSTILSAKTNIIQLNDIVDFKRGPFGGSLKKEIFVDEGYKVYEQKHAINNDFSIGNYYITPDKFEEMKGFELLPNDIIMSCSGTIGRFAVFPNDAEKGIINQALLRLRKSSDNVSDEYLLQCLKAISNKFEENSHGAGLKNVASVSVLKEIKVYCPSLSEQQKIVSKIEELEKQIAEARNIIDNSKQQKQAILDKYLK